ncbi:hypothetical protein VNO77_01113 [Canavalia gladiata]|uniref:Uncharacterized protein n=1 Tax=Canavalia gladiata TaxID=3824 RepID=A0AAN9R1X5_CANGL
MDCESKLWLVVPFYLSAIYMQQCAVGEPQVGCVFIFGDSLSDNGNNNNLSTSAKANYLPYGIDFPYGPTGRFTNGRTAADIITQLLGFEDFIPPFANISASDILKGVNYASGSAGIRKETGTHWGENISLELQLQNHIAIISQIAEKLGGGDQAQKHLNKCLYYVNIGSNDYLNNYFLPEFYPISQIYSPDQYAGILAQQYSMYIKGLHAVGARKFALIGLGPLGCIPHEVSVHGKNGLCVEKENKAALLFNDKVKAIVDRFNKELSDAKFIFINTLVITKDNPKLPDIDIIKCCKADSKTGLCIPNEKPCENRNLRPFFDESHPTEMVNQILARSAYNALSPIYTHPMNISELVKL